MPEMKSNDLDFSDYLDGVGYRGRTMLLPALIEAQNRYGYISIPNARSISASLKVPLADISGVIEFYSMLHDQPTGKTMVRVCTSPTCSAQGGRKAYIEAAERFTSGQFPQDQTADYFVEQVQCLGLCDLAPSALVNETAIGNISPGRILEHTDDFKTKIYAQESIITRRFGGISPTSLEDYLAENGFEGLRRAFKMKPDEICSQIKQSGLLGRGGAAFMTDIKWEGAASAEGKLKYVVCNADESEPGTFKDRVLLENDPFAILEGMIIAGFAIGAEHGFIYIRGEYPKAQKIFSKVIQSAEDKGFLGDNILDSGISFHVELRSGAGAYICGEETALFESIEGKRGFPRLKPPFPTTQGLFQKPTVINNVETFANVALILRIGVEQYCSYGTAKSSGPWLFCLSGDVRKPGLYEITRPLTLSELIDMAGGISDGLEIQTVLLGGAAGKFVPPDNLDVRLTQEDTRSEGLSLGSGAVIVLDETKDLRQTYSDLGHFFAHESCGKCYPCQLGTHFQAEILERIYKDEKQAGDYEKLQDVGWTMTDASLCGLGQTAASAILSAMEIWPDHFE